MSIDNINMTKSEARPGDPDTVRDKDKRHELLKYLHRMTVELDISNETSFSGTMNVFLLANSILFAGFIAFYVGVVPGISDPVSPVLILGILIAVLFAYVGFATLRSYSLTYNNNAALISVPGLGTYGYSRGVSREIISDDDFWEPLNDGNDKKYLEIQKNYIGYILCKSVNIKNTIYMGLIAAFIILWSGMACVMLSGWIDLALASGLHPLTAMDPKKAIVLTGLLVIFALLSLSVYRLLKKNGKNV